MLKRNSKKGFTLAELLIVVAIIAILVAIAVPLFVGALNEAEENVKLANERAVRGAAASAILLNYENYKLDSETKKELGWTAVAGVTKDGDIGNLVITKVTAAGTTSCETPKTDDTTYKDYKYKVTVYLTETDLPGTPG